MADLPHTALLVIAHGSRREEANAELLAICASLRTRDRYGVIQPAYLELSEPDIATGGALCVAAGATDVILLPYFLSPGKHVVEDLAAAREELTTRFPAIRFSLAAALGGHPAILDVLSDRARGAERAE